MIYISQGHEHSIALEVLVKALILLPPEQCQKFKLVCFKDSLIKTLKLLKLNFIINNQGISLGKNFLPCEFLNSKTQKVPQSTASLLYCLEMIKDNSSDILLTLPTSKDQLIYKNKYQKGHTEFFRSYYKKNDITMLFSSPCEQILLITDHIPLCKVAKEITSQTIINKVSLAVEYYQKYFLPFDEVYFSGINPHAGEGGLLGTEDKKINKAIDSLSKKFPLTQFLGPYSGDILSFYHRENKNQLLVYMYHDQGLSYFKSKYHFIGLNISIGLPMIRLSVDHGTAFELYGKNQASHQGCHYMLKSALKLN